MPDRHVRRAGALLTALVAGLVLTACGSAPDPHAAPTAADAPADGGFVGPLAPAGAPPSAPPDTAAEAPQAGPAPAAPPVRALAAATPRGMAVPAIGLRTSRFVGLGVTPAGAMEVPDDATTTGWYTLGPAPGEPGPAVIAAHVDYRGRPGVFTRLGDVREGDRIDVTGADGAVRTFTAYRVARFAKAAFPTQDVYGNTTGPELRLITCGGVFDRSSGHYADNVVVFARLA